MPYKLLDTFEQTFAGVEYRHRSSTNGDKIARLLYEDLYDLNRSPRFRSRVDSQLAVANLANKSHGIKARRGDGTLGELVPGATAILPPGMAVSEGVTATIEIGIEVKILMKAMIKQIDRVTTDLKNQAAEFRARGGNPIKVAIVGINHAPYCVSYEKDRVFRTDGKTHRHPIMEAAEAEKRLISNAASAYDHFIILRFIATNDPPFAFNWLKPNDVVADYGAALARISAAY